MWWHLFLEQLHFGIHLFAALVLFAVAWLYFDAWLTKRIAKESLRFSGFFALSLSFLVRAIILESPLVPSPLFGPGTLLSIYGVLHSLGYFLILASLVIDPIQKKPVIIDPYAIKPSTTPSSKTILPIGILLFDWLFPPLHWLGALLVGALYYHHATVGLEKHLAPVATSFFILSAAELLSISNALSITDNVTLYQWMAPFGIVWMISHLLLFLAILVLRKWVFGYLLKRFATQLFMIFTTTIVGIFIVTTITFTSFLLSNIQNESLLQLKSNVKVLNYALENKKSEILSDVQVVAQNPQIRDLIGDTSQKILRDDVEQFLLGKKQSSLIVVNSSGKVLARGEQPERFGDSLSDESFIKSALNKKETCGIITREGVLAPEILIRCASPIKKNGEYIGAVSISTLIDNAFVDGIKKQTDLDATLYAGDAISATTLVASDGSTRPLGIREVQKKITFPVLSQGTEYAGSVSFLNQSYLGAYLPLKGIEGQFIGMLFVGRPQDTILAAAGRSFELTFIITTILLVLSVVPAYFISNNISKQI